MFSDADLKSFAQRGISKDQVEQQIQNFKEGFPYLDLVRAAGIGDGIIRLNEHEVEQYARYYQENLSNLTIVKFVPASGAASRMFKDFFALMNTPEAKMEYPNAVQALQSITKFAFYRQLKEQMAAQGLDLHHALESENYALILSHILTDAGLNYGFLPKGLLSFHAYAESARVPAEEHMVEAAHYGANSEHQANLHFTVSPQHRRLFDALEQEKKPAMEQQYGVNFNITYSEQKPSTDTVAVDPDNRPFREADGSILFRPGGHGALLENLNEINGDVVFIKNIDNVVPDGLKDTTYQYKKALAGLLLETQSKIFNLLTRLDNDPQEQDLQEAATFLKDQLHVVPGPQQTEDLAYLKDKLYRPLRVCGMVRNEGEPGGGPFWVRDTDGSVSLQIGETSQIDLANAQQKELVNHATHFNPVDLVCSVRDYKGQKFNLLDFRDPNTGFISSKSKDGRELKALELPGLWNGAMAFWNTLFVEVPAITFNPVKTVNDLLRPEHQPQ